MEIAKLTVKELFRLVELVSVIVYTPCHLFDTLAIRKNNRRELKTQQLKQLMPVASEKHVKDDNEGHFIGQREIVAHRHVNILLDIDAAIAKPANSARLVL